jgi:dynein heavy chain
MHSFRCQLKFPILCLKDKFKAGLLAQSEEFKKQVSTLLEEFRAKGPFGSHIPCAAALANVLSIKEQLMALKEEEAILRKGLAIFKIDLPPSKEIAKLEGVSF